MITNLGSASGDLTNLSLTVWERARACSPSCLNMIKWIKFWTQKVCFWVTNEDVSNCVIMYLLILFISEELEPDLTFLLSIMLKTAFFSFVCIIMISLFWERNILNHVSCYREPTVRVISDLISIKFIRVVFNENKPSFGQKDDWFSKLFNNPSCACMLQQPTRSIKVLSPALHTERHFVNNNVLSSGTPKTGISTKISTSIFHNHYTSLYLRM